ERTVGGGFLQWQAEYSIFEAVAALRYDTYELDGETADASGDRVSPKVTLAATPITGLQFYGTYAEGYRAPSLSETIVDGLHPATFPTIAGSSDFRILPNPNLRPEVGKTFEVGVNVSYDDVLTAGDRFRAKVNVFRNDV